MLSVSHVCMVGFLHVFTPIKSQDQGIKIVRLCLDKYCFHRNYVSVCTNIQHETKMNENEKKMIIRFMQTQGNWLRGCVTLGLRERARFL